MSRVWNRDAAVIASMAMILALSGFSNRALIPLQNTCISMLLYDTLGGARLDTLSSRFRIDGVHTLA